MENFIGKYCYERYRYVKNKDNVIIKQGMGLEGIVKSIRHHKALDEFIVKFDNCYCQLKYVTADKKLKDIIIPLTINN